MSSKFPTRREKPHSSKPYDRPKSFLQRVTKHVADYLPSWLNPSSWVGGQSERPPNELPPDEETGEEEEFDIAGPSGLSSPVTQRSTSDQRTTSLASTFTRKPLERSPPSTQQQTLVNGDDHSDNSETSASTSGCSSLAPSQERKRAPSSEVRSSSQLKGLQVSKHHLEKIQKQLNSKPLFTIPGSETEQTPSTVSSPEVPASLPGPVTDPLVAGSQRTIEKARKRVSVEHCATQNIEKDVETSSTRTSLWSEDDEKSSQTNKRPRTARPQPVAPNKRPCFSVSAFGSPLRISHDKLPQSTETNLSPFYQGNTTYGGASAYKKARISTPYNSVLHAEAMKVRQMSSTGVLSSAAQKVLNILENMSTPLTDAKKIPVENVSTDFALSYTPSIYARRPLRQDTPQSQLLSSGPPKTSYPIHTSSSQQKPSPLLAILSQTTTPSRLADSATPVSKTQSEGQEKRSGGAVRTRVSQTLRPSKNQRSMEEEPAPPPDLPEVSLIPKGSIPTFSFSIPTLTSTPIGESLPPVLNAKRKEVPVIDLVPDKEDASQADKFIFSSPIENKPPLEVVLDDTQGKDNFQFRSPVFKTSSSCENQKITPAPSPVTKANVVNFSAFVGSSSTSPLRRKKPVEPSCEEPTFGGGLRPASDLIVGRSVMDILGKPATSAIQEKESSQEKTGFGSAFQKKATEWDCDVCMVRNKDSDACCVSCTSPRPSPKPTTNTLPPISSMSGFGSKFAPPSGSWSCPTCMINNSETALNCVACAEPKPGASILKVDSLSGNTNSPKTMPKVSEVPAGCPKQWTGPPVTSTVGTWECDTCLVRNKEGVSKCCSCETPRANAPTTGVKETFTGFKFGQASKDTGSISTFSFGSKDTTSAKNVTSSSGFGATKADKKDATSQSTAGFKFGDPASSDSTGPSGVQEGFKFGLPISKDSQGGSKLPEGFKFGPPVTKAPDSEGKPTFTFGSSTNATSETGGFKFGLPAQPNFKGDSKRTDGLEKSEVACEVVSSSTASTEVEGNSGECGEGKTSNKVGFVFGGQSAACEMKSETTPTLTFGQKTAETSKPVLSASVLKQDETSSEKKNAVLFGDSAGKLEQSGLAATGQGSTVGFKFGGQTELKQGVTSSTSVNGDSEKQCVKPMFNFGSPRAPASGNKNLAAVDAPAPAVSSSFQFTSKGKESDTEQMKSVTTGPVFGAQQVSSTTTVGLSSFTTTTTTTAATASVPNSSVTFGATQSPFSTAASTSVSTGAQNSTAPFVFGTPKPSQVPAGGAGGFTFSFGSSTPGNTAAKPASTFSFGSTANSTSTVPPASSTPFTFGKVDPTPASDNRAQPQTTPVFTFGTPTNAANASSNTGSAFGTPQASKPVFGFGTPGAASTATPSLPAFGQPTAVGPAVTTEPFSFGSSSSMTNSTAPSGGMFQMEAAKPVAPAAPVFRFGAAQPEAGASQQAPPPPLFGAPQLQPGVFTFGSPTVPSIGPTFADSSSPFVFGSAAASTGANTAQAPAASGPSFNFQAGTAANPFSVAGNASNAQRPIRKAIRRVVKKK